MGDIDPKALMRLEKGPLKSQFPISFDNGMSIQDMVFPCHGCGCAFRADLLCGTVTKINGCEFLLEAAGVCKACNLVITFDIKLFDDRSFAMMDDGKWVKIATGPLSAPPSTSAPAPQEPPSLTPAKQVDGNTMAKIGTLIMGLRLGWIGAYIYSIAPALEAISNGLPNTFTSMFLQNGFLIFVGYVCSVMLVVQHFKKR